MKKIISFIVVIFIVCVFMLCKVNYNYKNKKINIYNIKQNKILTSNEKEKQQNK